MLRTSTITTFAVLAMTLAPVAAPAIEAAPLATQATASTSMADTVQYRGHRGYGYRRGGGWGWGPGAVIGGLIVGGALTAAAIAEHRASDRAIAACARDFRSFDPRSGTYVTYEGQVRVCPYLY